MTFGLDEFRLPKAFSRWHPDCFQPVVAQEAVHSLCTFVTSRCGEAGHSQLEAAGVARQLQLILGWVGWVCRLLSNAKTGLVRKSGARVMKFGSGPVCHLLRDRR